MVSLIPGSRLMSRLRRRSSRSLLSQSETGIPQSAREDPRFLDNSLMLNMNGDEESNNRSDQLRQHGAQRQTLIPGSSESCSCSESKCKGREESDIYGAERVESGGTGASLDEAIEQRRLKSVKSASGMSQQDLRATIREVQMDQSLSPEEKSKKIQEIMSFSWRKSQEKVISNSGSSRRRNRTNSTKSLRRFKSAGSIAGNSHSTPRTQSGYISSAQRIEISNSRNSSSNNLSGIDAISVDDELTDPENDSDDEEYEDVFTFYHDQENGVYGCKHYERRCCVSAPCCDEFYCCRFCHDEGEGHSIKRQEINRCRCMKCGHIQGISRNCESCSTEFARYFCSTCKFFDDKEGKNIYHCDKCNICRIGEGLGVDYFHCDRCNACMSITLKDHKCVERSLESDCPVCSEFLFTSTIPVMFLPCGHCIHVKCYEHYTATNYTCPICGKSLGDMQAYFRRIDDMLATEQMPEEYRDLRSRIFCADCELRSIAPFHFVYHKCKHCGSYNTKVLEQLQGDVTDLEATNEEPIANPQPAPRQNESIISGPEIHNSSRDYHPPRPDSRTRRLDVQRNFAGIRRSGNR